MIKGAAMAELKFREILKRKRLEQSWSQGEAAERLGINANTWSRWERGLNVPTDPYVHKKLRSLLKLTPEEMGLLPGLAKSEPLALDETEIPQPVSPRFTHSARPHILIVVTAAATAIIVSSILIYAYPLISAYFSSSPCLRTASTSEQPSATQREWKELQKGARGESVRTLQYLLFSCGYDLGPNKIDGEFGSDTRQAVKAFQHDHRLVPDGVVTAQTWEMLFKWVLQLPDQSILYRALQRQLKAHYNGMNLELTDKFDSTTDRVLQQYQIENKLPPESKSNADTFLTSWCFLVGGTKENCPQKNKDSKCPVLHAQIANGYAFSDCLSLRVSKEGVQVIADFWCKAGASTVIPCTVNLAALWLKKDVDEQGNGGQSVLQIQNQQFSGVLPRYASSLWCEDSAPHLFQAWASYTVTGKVGEKSIAYENKTFTTIPVKAVCTKKA
jgi:transcriptional regulator with XRE-family HTH domain